jgi:crossover junction endodeoxyribonuclease RuvC
VKSTELRICRILGIDPGSQKTGWGIVDFDLETRKLKHVDNGVIRLAKGDLSSRVTELSRRLHQILEEYRPQQAAIEDVFVNKGPRSAITLGQARGAALATVGLCGIPAASYASTQVKSRVTGRGRASKEQVAETVRILLTLPERPFEDAADALAVSICHAFSQVDLHPGIDRGQESRQGRKPKKRGREALADLARRQGKLK